MCGHLHTKNRLTCKVSTISQHTRNNLSRVMSVKSDGGWQSSEVEIRENPKTKTKKGIKSGHYCVIKWFLISVDLSKVYVITVCFCFCKAQVFGVFAIVKEEKWKITRYFGFRVCIRVYMSSLVHRDSLSCVVYMYYAHVYTQYYVVLCNNDVCVFLVLVFGVVMYRSLTLPSPQVRRVFALASVVWWWELWTT
jgi:hypothetical protein